MQSPPLGIISTWREESSSDDAGPGSESSTGSDGGEPVGCDDITRTTEVYDGQTHQFVEVQATCRGQGERARVFVQDDLWNAPVDQAQIEALVDGLERTTPEGSIDSSRGVIANNEDVFGVVAPEVLDEGRVTLFIVDTQGGGDGYLCTWCDSLQLHLDGVKLDPLGGEDAISIAAHESYHLIHIGYDPDEFLWVDEVMAEAAMIVNGFYTDDEWAADFMNDPDQNWGPGDPELGGFNYGAALLFGTFLWEQQGVELMQAITAEPADDWAGLDAALASVGSERSAFELYLDTMVAIGLDAPELGYGFESIDPGSPRYASELLAGAPVEGELEPYGMDVHQVLAEGEFTVTATSTGAEPVHAIAVAAGGEVRVVPVDGPTTFTVGAGDTAFVALTAEAGTTYQLTLE